MSDSDYRHYYDLEGYLFDCVGPRFRDQGSLDAFDLFCIVIWKANRSKSRIAARLLKPEPEARTLEDSARELTAGIADRPEARERLCYLLGPQWGLRLPMASAILSVLYPDEFTVYDQRVCDELREFEGLAEISDPQRLWEGYQAYKQAVERETPAGLSLRDKDRYLWGRSFAKQLQSDILAGFGGAAPQPQHAINIDASPVNADWTKQTWDLPAHDLPSLREYLAAEGLSVAEFRRLPVYLLNVDKLPWLRDL
jgi:hypothetical protein